MKHRLTFAAILAVILCLLAFAPAFAGAEVPEGYPAVRIDPDTNLPYNFGGRTVYIYDWWSSDDAEHSNREEHPNEDTQKLYAYRDWLEETYNVKIVETALGDWSSQPEELANINAIGGLNGQGAEGDWCVIAIAADFIQSALRDNLFTPLTAIDAGDSKWNQADSAMMTVNGSVYGVNAEKTEPRNCIYFNKRILTEAGIDWNTIYNAQQEGNWTWEMMENLMAQVQANTSYSGMVCNGDELAAGLVCSNNAAFFDYDENGQLVIAADRPETIEALEQYLEWIDAYMAQQPEDADWDWFKYTWAEGNAAFYPAQAWQGFNDGSEMSGMGMTDEWGCVMYPKGPHNEDTCDTYLSLASDNIYGIPNVYDEDTAEMIQVIYDLYTNDTPGVSETDAWVGSKLNYTDQRAVYETFGMMREEEHNIPNTTIVLGSVNDVLGRNLLWGQLGSMSAEEAVTEASRVWERMLDNFYHRASNQITLVPADYNEDFVQIDENGNVTVQLNQWVHFTATAPDADYISFHALRSEDEEPNDNNEFGGDFTDKHDPERRVDRQWIEVGYSETITRYIVAQAHYFIDDKTEMTLASYPVKLQAVCDTTINGNVTFTVPQDQNDPDMNKYENGRYQIPRDGRLFVDVDNMEGVGFFGLYIAPAGEGQPWLADSHWVPMSDGETTRVPLTVPRCAVGEDYEVRVFAIKFGAPQKDARDPAAFAADPDTEVLKTIPIRVTEASSDCPVILSMKSTFETGEPLRVFAHYTNPADEEFPQGVEDGALQIRIWKLGNPDNEAFCEMQGFEDFWNDGDCIWESGEYVVDAYIFQYGQVVRSYENIKHIWVEAHGRTTAPEVQKKVSIPAGQNLVLALHAEAQGTGEDATAAPEWFEYALFRLDWGFAFMDAGGTDGVDANGDGTITIGADRFEAGGLYLIRLFSMKPGYDVGVTEFIFAVTSTDTEKLVLTLNGKDAMEQDFLSSSNIHVKVSYGNGERPTAIRIMNGDHMEHWWGDEDNFERDWGFGDNEYIMFAEATWDKGIDFDDPDLDLNRDVAWTGRSNVIRLSITSPYGVMKEPQFGILNEGMAEGHIPWGDDIVLRIDDEGPTATNGDIIEDGWFFVNFDVERIDEESGDSWWERVNHNWGYDVHSGDNLIPTWNLEPGCRYRMEVGADAEGYSGRSRWIEFELGERQNPEQTVRYFTVNGHTEDFESVTYTELRMLAYRSDAEWYNVEITEKDNEGWRDDRGDSHSGMLMDGWRPDHAGDYTLTAYAYGRLPEGQTDEEGHDFWEDEIGSITVTANADNGDLGPITAHMDDKAYVGDPLEIAFNLVDHAEEYGYWIHRDTDNGWLMGETVRTAELAEDEAPVMTIDTGRLEPGVYWVEMDAMATGYNQTHGTLHFALFEETLDCSPAEGDYYFSADRTQVTTEEDAVIIAYIPGTEEVRLSCIKDKDPEDENPEMWEVDHRNGPGLTTRFCRGDSGTYTIYLSGKMDGLWRYPFEVCTITVTKEHDFDHEPAVTVNGSALADTVPADADNPARMTVRVAKDANAQGYHIQLEETDGGEMIFNGFADLNREGEEDWFTIENNELILEIEDGRIEPGRLYRIGVWAHAPGYECSGNERTFLLQDETAAQNVTLIVQPTGDEGYWTGDNAEIHVTAPANATALRVHMNNEVRWYRGNEMEDRWNVWDPDTVFYAYATTDGLPEGDFDWNDFDFTWSMRSEVVRIQANTLGYIPEEDMPVVTLENSHVTKGGWVTVTVSGGIARQTDIRIRDEWNNEREFRRTWMPGTYRLPTANLEPGWYRVTVDCVQDKYMWTHGAEPDLWIDAPEPEDDEGFFIADKTTLYPGEPFIPSVYWPGAVHVWIGSEDWNLDPDNWDGIWGDWNGDNGTNHADWEWWFDDPGEYELIAWALEEGAEQVREIGRITFTVNEPTQLAAPDIQVDNTVNVTEPIYVDIPVIEGAKFYSLQVHVPDMENQPVFRYYMTADNAEDGKITFTIPANELTPNASYWIDCFVDPADRDYSRFHNESSKNILTMGGTAADTWISVAVDEGQYVTADENGIFIPINAPFSVTVTAEQPSHVPAAVALYMGDQVQYRLFRDRDGTDDTENFGLSEYQPWPETIFARAYYGNLDSYDREEDVPWDSLNWEAPCTPVQVTFTSHGPADPADADAPWATLEGNDLIIHVRLGAHANEAHANLEPVSNDGEEDLVFRDWFGWDEDEDNPGTGIIRIPTDGLATVCYRVYVDSSGIGYDNNRTTMWKWVVENPYDSWSKLTLPASLREIEEEAFEGIAADTVIIPDGVTRIGARAFADSRVRLLVIPDSVTDIAPNAFDSVQFIYIHTWREAVEQWIDDFGAKAFCYLD